MNFARLDERLKVAKAINGPDDVDAAVYMLRHTVADLVEYRHTKGDRVFEERKSIHAAASALQGLIEDLEYAGNAQ